MTRTVLVTGASRGLGRAIALRLAASGDRVIVGHRQRAEAAQEVLAQIEAGGGQGQVARFDLRDADAVQRSLAQLRQACGPITALVNNAALPDEGMFAMSPAARVDEVLEVGLQGALRCTRALARDMLVAGGGAIVNVSSVITRRGQPGQVAYATAKGAIEAFTRALALELGPAGVRVNAVVAGVFDAGITKAQPADRLERWTQAIPLGRLGRGEELAEAVAWLLSPASSYVTGSCLVVDGGLSL